jgi:hypothetical protein
MRRFKEFTRCVDILRDAQRESDNQSGQFEEIEKTIELIRDLRRMNNPTKIEVIKIVRQITERLLKAFSK